MKLKLPDSVSSSQDLKALIAEIREYAKWFAHVVIKQRVDAKNANATDTKRVEAPAASPAAAEILNEWAAKKPLSSERLDELIAVLEECEETAPALTITLAAPAAGDLKRILVAWCRANIAPDVLVTFQFNSTLLGGMVVRYGSRIFDWSFRRQILAGRQKFPEVLRHV